VRFRPRTVVIGILVALGAWGLLLASCTPMPVATTDLRITLVVDGDQRVVTTRAATVREFLNERDIVLGPLDRVSPPETALLQDGMTVTVVRVIESIKVITETLPFERQVVHDTRIPLGQTQLLQSGQEGVLERRYRVTVEDGEEVARVLVSESITQSPRDEVVLLGSQVQLHNVPISGTLAYLANQDAWVMRGNSFQRQRLTQLGDLDGRVFALSPDGGWLLFTRTATETTRLNELWLIRTTEAAPNPLPLGVDDILWADWAPGGSQIAWTTAEVTSEAPGWRGHNDLWTARITQKGLLVSRRRILAPQAGGGYGWWGTRYAWSPDGETLAYSRPDGIGVIDLKSKTQLSLLRFPAVRTYSSWAWNPDLDWDPAGKFLATVVHASNGSGNPEGSPVFHLRLIDRDGVYSATLALEVGMWAAPRFSPHGDVLLFGRAVIPYQSATSRYHLFLMDRDGSNQRLVYGSGSDLGLELPEWHWSPDGESLAFISNGDLMLLSLNDGEVSALTNEGGVTRVIWCP